MKAFIVRCFDDNYGCDFVKFVLERFGQDKSLSHKGFYKDKQEVVKYLLGEDLKTVAPFGYPHAKKNIFSVKLHTYCFKF